LLGLLAEQFKASDFDVKHLIRAICNSQTYQRTSKPLPGNLEDETLFSHMAIKVMTPEQLYDSLQAVLGEAPRRAVAPRQRQQPANPRDAFVAFFQGEEGALPTEYQAGVPQALRLMNSGLYNNPNNQLLQEIQKSNLKPEQAIERIYLATLSRRPTAAESQKMLAHVSKGDSRTAYSDVLWAILNTSEFAFNH
jgi:hypothetical protein